MTHLVLGFPQHFLFADIIDSQCFPNTRNQSPLEGKECQWNVIDLRLHEVSKRVRATCKSIYLVDQFKVCSVISELVHP